MSYGDRTQALKDLFSSVFWWTMVVFAWALALGVVFLGICFFVAAGVTGDLWYIVPGLICVPLTILVLHLISYTAGKVGW